MLSFLNLIDVNKSFLKKGHQVRLWSLALECSLLPDYIESNTEQTFNQQILINFMHLFIFQADFLFSLLKLKINLYFICLVKIKIKLIIVKKLT